MKVIKQKKRPLVEETTARLRELILEREPGAQIGSLQDIADRLNVGIVTVQQAARILEYEGLLAVKRGPGGGYYGARPDEEALSRALASYIQVHGLDYVDIMKMVTLLDVEMTPGAAHCYDETLCRQLQELLDRIDDCDTIEKISDWERELRVTLFKMIDRPVMELFVNVIRNMFSNPRRIGPPEERRIKEWKSGRKKVVQAIVEHDEEWARFESERYRQMVIRWFDEMGSESHFDTK